MIEVTSTKIDTTKTQKKQGKFDFTGLKSLVIGAGSLMVGMDKRGLWAGAADFDNAPFRVTMDGSVTGIGLSGQTITGSTINGGTINGADISGGTIVGGTIKTSTSPDRVELNGADGALYVYVGGDRRVILSDFALAFLGMGEVSGGAIYAGGTNQLTIDTGGQTFDFTDSGLSIGSVLIWSGTGSPETVVTAPKGSLYLRTNGGAGTTLYVKESGVGNTGWVGK